MTDNLRIQREIMNMVNQNLNYQDKSSVIPRQYNDRTSYVSTGSNRMGNKEAFQHLQNLHRMRKDPMKESVLEKRSQEYRKTINKIQENDRNAFRLFELENNFTLKQLKKKYIKLTKICHPDKPGGSDDRFSLVTKYYLYLLDYFHTRNTHLKYQQAEKQNIGNNYERLIKSRKNQADGLENSSKLKLGSGKKFDVNTFNTIFQKNQFYDPTHEGYGNWLKTSNEDEAKNAPKMFGNKFNKNVFHAAFTEEQKRQNTAIIPIDQVQSFNQNTIGAGGVELLSNNDNFSNINNSLQAVDLKEVYSNGLLGVNPQMARQNFRSTREYEQHRANSMTNLTQEEKIKEKNRKEMFVQHERSRLQRIAERDAAISDHFMRIQGLLQ